MIKYTTYFLNTLKIHNIHTHRVKKVIKRIADYAKFYRTDQYTEPFKYFTPTRNIDF